MSDHAMNNNRSGGSAGTPQPGAGRRAMGMGPGGMGGGPGGGMMRGKGEKAKNFKGTLSRLLAYLKPHRYRLIAVFALAVASTAFTIMAPKISGQVMNKVKDSFVARAVVTQLGSVQRKIKDAVEARMREAAEAAAKAAAEAAARAEAEARAVAAAAKAANAAQSAAGAPAAAGRQAAGMQAALAGLTPEQKGAMAQLMPVLASGVDFPIAVAGLPAEARAALAALTPDQQAGFQALLQLRAQAAGPAAAAPPAPADAESARNSPTRAATVGDAPAAPAPAFDPAMIALIQNFLALPLLTETTDPAVLADTVRKLIDLLSSLPPEAAALMAAPAAGAADTGSGMGGTAAAGAGGLKFTPDQIDDAIRAIRITGGEVDYAGIAVILAWLLGFYLASALFTFATGWLMSTVAQRTVSDLRGQVDRKLGKLPLKYFDSRTHGEILSRVTNDVDTISTTLQQSVTQAITSVIQLVGFIAMMLSISWELTLIVLATLPLYVGATMLLAGQSQKFFAAQQKELGAISGHIEEMYSGHAVVKACGREDRALADFDAINERLAKAGWKAQFVSGILFPAMNFISNLGYVLISVVGGVWMTKARLNLGDITAFIQYSRSFTQPIIQTANIANVIQSTVACAERVFEVLDEAEEQADAPGAALPAAVKGEVAIKNLAFSYKPEEPLIKDLSLDVKKGHTIAIVGPTGAGKTTLVNLLMRFYETQGGSIAIDGKDIRDMPRSGLRSLFGMVLQDTWLFNGTIRDNIAYGKDGATEDDVVRAAKAAHADHFIRTLPLGYDTVLNEEATNISSGQKQLLTIARAILADPAILILDEATSSVDTRTEVLIQQAMAALMSDRTAFVIAHRLSTIRDAELILVMDKGSIIEQGNHRELLAKGGFYADLYNAQFTGAPISA